MTDNLIKRLRADQGYRDPGVTDEAADRLKALTAENEWLRKALEEAPIIGLLESGDEFMTRQDNWLKTKAFPALEKQP